MLMAGLARPNYVALSGSVMEISASVWGGPLVSLCQIAVTLDTTSNRRHSSSGALERLDTGAKLATVARPRRVRRPSLALGKSLKIISLQGVAQSFAAIIAAIGTPAQEPKSRGKSPGWPKGQPRSARTRYPTVKKRASKRKKSQKTWKPLSQVAA